MSIKGRRVANIVITSVVLPAVVLIVLFDYRLVEGDSMNPVLKNGQFVLFCRWVYGVPRVGSAGFLLLWGSPERGDILVYSSPIDGRDAIKRCVAVAGDLIEQRGGELYINGSYPVGRYEEGRARISSLSLPAGTFFCIGDNHSRSVDSTTYGVVSMERLIGKVVFSGSGG